MSGSPRRWRLQLFRVASLVVPSVFAWYVALSASNGGGLARVVTLALGPLWVLTAGALFYRTGEALYGRLRDPTGPSVLDGIDVLTASGSGLAWWGAIAIVASVWIGWASLAVIGLLGLGLLHLVVVWTSVMVGGADPWRRASLSRRFAPDRVVEGDRVVEQVRLSGPRIPIGFRLFASGRVARRWPMSRYVAGEADSGGEVVFESDVGPALRGEHEAEPLDVWLQDVFGLCRSERFRAGSARLVVLPRPCPVDGSKQLVGDGGHDVDPRPERRAPTEGSLRLREYQPGDDARRIHWVRSLAARQMVVRLPDEVPRDRPSVRVVLDTFLAPVDGLSCPAPAALLDALVTVWLSVGRALAQGGVRVTLVTAEVDDRRAAPSSRRLTAHALPDVLRAAAHVRWQDSVRVSDLVADDEDTIVVACRLLPNPSARGSVRWIVVPESVWTPFCDVRPRDAFGMFAHPMGSADNRRSRRKRERQRWQRALRDHTTFATAARDVAAPWPGCFVARPAPGRIRLEALA